MSRSPTKDEYVRVTVQLPLELGELVKARAAEKVMSHSSVVLELLNELDDVRHSQNYLRNVAGKILWSENPDTQRKAAIELARFIHFGTRGESWEGPEMYQETRDDTLAAAEAAPTSPPSGKAISHPADKAVRDLEKMHKRELALALKRREREAKGKNTPPPLGGKPAAAKTDGAKDAE